MASYKASLDRLWDLFGEDRIFFGSDWPNSDTLASYDETFGSGATIHRDPHSNRPAEVLLEELDFGIQMAPAHSRPVTVAECLTGCPMSRF